MKRAITLAVLVMMSSLPAAAFDLLLVANKSGHTVDLVDLGSGRSIATLPTGHAPHEIAVSRDGRRAWVAATQSDVVAVIDPATLEVIDLVRAGREPDGMALAGR